MTLKEVMALVNAGYTKSEIQAMAADQQTPPAAPAAQTPGSSSGGTGCPDDRPGADRSRSPAADDPRRRSPVTLSDVLGAVNQLAAKINTPAQAPAFGEPQPRGLDDMVTGFLGVTAPNAPKQ